ncbi:MAG: DeoR/GlpR family DNA-binding transcription regulator [Chloroflexi bacterium]|nr:DeoR/GlpR family DNA-binding transcription regulator [Chloroflexota bacterium]
MRYVSAQARRQRILDLVRAASFLGAAELSERLGVSEMTIRRDVRLLSYQGLVRAVHGGVTPITGSTTGTDFRVRSTLRHEAKSAIAAAALALMGTDGTIALDTGTTVLELATLLAAPLRLSVVTPSLPVMVALSDQPGIEVTGLGGTLHSESQGFAGPATLAALRSLSVNQVFLGTTAIGRGALWCGNPWDAETKRELISIADEVVLLADSAKFVATAMANIVPLGAIHILVTDDGILAADRREVEAAGVRVVVAGSAARE